MSAEPPKPVFYDPTHRRWRLIAGLFLVAVLAICAPFAVLTVRIIEPPTLPVPPLAQIAPTKAPVPPSTVAPSPQAADAIGGVLRSVAALLRGSRSDAVGGAIVPMQRMAYLPVDDESAADSVRSNIDAIDVLLIDGYMPVGPDMHIGDLHSSDGKPVVEAMKTARRGLRSMAVVSDSTLPPQMMMGALANRAIRASFIDHLVDFAIANRFGGIDLEIGSIDDTGMRRYEEFVGELHRALAPHGVTLAVTVGLDDPAYHMDVLSRAADLVIVDAVDLEPSATTPAPLQPQTAFADALVRRTAGTDPSRIVVAIANSAYDWNRKTSTLQGETLQEAIEQARVHDAAIHFDPAALNPGFDYRDAGGADHSVWYLDAVTAFNQMREITALGIGGVALDNLGTEDAGMWSLIRSRGVLDTAGADALRDFSFLHRVEYHGAGTVLHLTGAVVHGSRSVSYDRVSGLIVGEQVTGFPTVPVATLAGVPKPKEVALTFDDGPDPSYTDDVLDILDQYDVKATFFVVGRNVLRHPELLQRIVADGNDIGNHTFFHPEITSVSRTRYALELSANARVIESSVGRRTVLFRPPDGDALWATSPTGMTLLAQASDAGYFTVGYTIDTLDWLIHDRANILRTAIGQARANNGGVILLHDSGGDRSATIAALPELIQTLQADGFTFTTVSGLMGLSRDDVMPVVARNSVADRLQDLGFALLRSGGAFLTAVFTAAIGLSIVRVGLIIVLALANRRREEIRPDFLPEVTVIVPAHNEEKVITKTVRSLLASSYPNVRILVVDDGSRDRTAAVVAEQFAGDPRVRLFSKPNGGKASALNLGLAFAETEIVVMLDADTVFRRDTIFHLTRPFADPEVAAVAGNAKVGNRDNLITRWQALEYIISQNLDRRAFELLNGISVVPGAVGAWRRSPVHKVGGFTSDTLAEDADLTIRLSRAGYKVRNAPAAIAMTEAPDTVHGLVAQRSRWTLGTLQAVWKNRDVILRRDGGVVGLVMLPHILLFQFVLPLISPLADLFLFLAVGDAVVQKLQNSLHPASDPLLPVLIAYAVFLVVDFAIVFVAYLAEPHENHRLIVWLPLQRFFYRQLLYYVTVKSVVRALIGAPSGWISITRKSTVAGALPKRGVEAA
ncbi:MAG: glycosyltransferase [Bauldia sp.]